MAEFVDNLKKLDIILDKEQENAFERYYELLVEWNSFMNLTAITEHEEVLLKHFTDSLAVQTVLQDKNCKIDLNLKDALKVMDVGTGAGFPGIPLKIAFPNLEVTLLDSLNNRIKFLNEVIQQLSLTNIQAIHGRAEDYAHQKEYREQFDVCVSRAVANLTVLCEYCLPYVAVGGYFISYKSGMIEEELEESKRAIGILGGEIVAVHKITLPGSDIDRSFVVIRKVKKMAGKYPRKAGLPAKEPIH